MKRLWLVLLLAVAAVVGLMAPDASAVNPDSAYVIVRCTMVTSVDVIDTADKVFMNGFTAVGANEVWISSFVRVQNDGTGSITNWSLRISTQHYSTNATVWLDTTTAYVGWAYGDTLLTDNELNRCVLAAIFKDDTTAAIADFNANDILSQEDNLRYQETTGRFGSQNGYYDSDFYSPSGYNMIANAGTQPIRNLFFYLRTPTGVTDEQYRRFTILVTAAIGL